MAERAFPAMLGLMQGYVMQHSIGLVPDRQTYVDGVRALLGPPTDVRRAGLID